MPPSSPYRFSGVFSARLPRGLPAVLIAGLLADACAGDEPQGLSRDRFVAAYVAMVQARIEAQGDSAAYRAGRDRALDRLGLTAGEMREFLEHGKQDPEQLGDAWEAIAAKLDTLYGGVTTEPPPVMRRELEAEGETPEPNGELGSEEPADDDVGTEGPGVDQGGGRGLARSRSQ